MFFDLMGFFRSHKNKNQLMFRSGGNSIYWDISRIPNSLHRNKYWPAVKNLHNIKIYGVKLWNLLSQYIVESPTYLFLKRRYKKYLLDTLWLIFFCVVNYNHLFICSRFPIPLPYISWLLVFVMFSQFFSLISFCT